MARRPKIIQRINTEVGAFIHRYDGFRLSCLVGVLLLWFYIIYVLAVSQWFPSLSDLVSRTWFVYLWRYWLSHPLLFGIVLITYFSLVAFDLLKGSFVRRMQDLPSHPLDRRRQALVRLMTRGIGILLTSLTLMVIPVFHLVVPSWQNWLVTILSLAGAIFSIWTFVVPPVARERLRAKARFTFPGPCSFDTASMGGQAREVQKELEIYSMIRSQSPISGHVQTYLEKGDNVGYWRGCSSFFERLAQFLQVPVGFITLHQNTTAAIRRALRLSITAKARVITTDLEYGSVAAAVKELSKEVGAEVRVLELRHNLLERQATARTLADSIVNAVQEERGGTGLRTEDRVGNEPCVL